MKKIMKENFELIYRMSFIIICTFGLIIHFDINDQDYNTHEFSFFTIQSNIFCLVIMCILLIKHFSKSDTRSKSMMYFKGMALSSIICTFLVYHFGECRNVYPIYEHGLFSIPLKSLLAHYIIPAMYILDWILFQPKGYFKFHYIITWLAFPLFYILCFFTRCQCNDDSAFKCVPKFPYYFLDYETLGYGQCFCYLGWLLFLFLAINTLIVFADFLLHKYGEPDEQCKRKKNHI